MCVFCVCVLCVVLCCVCVVYVVFVGKKTTMWWWWWVEGVGKALPTWTNDDIERSVVRREECAVAVVVAVGRVVQRESTM